MTNNDIFELSSIAFSDDYIVPSLEDTIILTEDKDQGKEQEPVTSSSLYSFFS